MKEYPKWIFHKTKAPMIVESKEDHDAQGTGWEETPAKFGQESHPAAAQSEGDQASEEQGQEELKPLTKKDFLKMKVSDLQEFLIEAGVSKEDLDGLKKDELIAKIGSL